MSSETVPVSTPHFEQNGPTGPVPSFPPPDVDAPISEDDDFVEVLNEEETQPKRKDSGRHREMLAICCFAVVMSFCLEIVGGDRVAFRGHPDHPLPHTCFLRSEYGIPCPGCGLTRSFILLADGELRASIAMHRCGVLLAIAVLVQIPYRHWVLSGKGLDRLSRCVLRCFSWLLIAALILNWLAKLRGY